MEFSASPQTAAAILARISHVANSWTALQTFTAGLTVSSGTTVLQAVTCTELTASGKVQGSYTRAIDGPSTVPSSAVSAFQTTAEGGYPAAQWVHSAAAANSRIWDAVVVGTNWQLRCVDDAYSSPVVAITISRSGTTPGTATFTTGVAFAGTTPGTPSAGQVLIGGGEIKAYSRFSSELESDTVLTGGFLKGPLGYTYIRQGATDHSWNVDVYNGGAFINALKIEQDGSATFARTVRIGGGTPGSASAGGTAGAVVWDASYIYVCIATDTWKRVAIATW